MNSKTKKALTTALIATFVLAAGCSDLNRTTAPVALLVTNTQEVNRFDIAPNAANCDADIAKVNIRAVLLSNPNNTNLPTDVRFNEIRLTSYRVSYVRRDGGTLVPAPFTRAMSGTLTAGGTSTDLTPQALEVGAINQAPFAALRPSGGGRDPETGRSVVTMDAIIEVFGETFSGERVSGSTRVTLDFCYLCNGCA